MIRHCGSSRTAIIHSLQALSESVSILAVRRIVECIPNFSEGRRSEVIDQIVAAIKSVPGAVLLDYESDYNHNRSVITFVAPPQESRY